MAEDIKALIEKIKQEGVQAAQEKAGQIEQEARRRAEGILQQARAEAGNIISKAKEEAAKTEQKQKMLLEQAGRDFLLVLKQRITAMLDELINLQVKEILTPQALGEIIFALINTYAKPAQDEIIVSLNSRDIDGLRGFFVGKLKVELKKGLVLKPSEDIQAGFVISFDSGRSQFDFSDKALADYITSYLKPSLAGLLNSV
jgi:V/A-type H+-transporting ATPase subunit E